jgi:methionyl-tRNA synthetase
MLQPVIPGFVDKSLRFLKEDKIKWNSINNTLIDCKIDNFEAIVTRIDDNHLDKLLGN